MSSYVVSNAMGHGSQASISQDQMDQKKTMSQPPMGQAPFLGQGGYPLTIDFKNNNNLNNSNNVLQTMKQDLAATFGAGGGGQLVTNLGATTQVSSSASSAWSSMTPTSTLQPLNQPSTFQPIAATSSGFQGAVASSVFPSMTSPMVGLPSTGPPGPQGVGFIPTDYSLLPNPNPVGGGASPTGTMGGASPAGMVASMQGSMKDDNLGTKSVEATAKTELEKKEADEKKAAEEAKAKREAELDAMITLPDPNDDPQLDLATDKTDKDGFVIELDKDFIKEIRRNKEFIYLLEAESRLQRHHKTVLAGLQAAAKKLPGKMVGAGENSLQTNDIAPPRDDNLIPGQNVVAGVVDVSKFSEEDVKYLAGILKIEPASAFVEAIWNCQEFFVDSDDDDLSPKKNLAKDDKAKLDEKKKAQEEAAKMRDVVHKDKIEEEKQKRRQEVLDCLVKEQEEENLKNGVIELIEIDSEHVQARLREAEAEAVKHIEEITYLDRRNEKTIKRNEEVVRSLEEEKLFRPRFILIQDLADRIGRNPPRVKPPPVRKDVMDKLNAFIHASAKWNSNDLLEESELYSTLRILGRGDFLPEDGKPTSNNILNHKAESHSYWKETFKIADEYGTTLLILAAKNGWFSIVNLILNDIAPLIVDRKVQNSYGGNHIFEEVDRVDAFLNKGRFDEWLQKQKEKKEREDLLKALLDEEDKRKRLEEERKTRRNKLKAESPLNSPRGLLHSPRGDSQVEGQTSLLLSPRAALLAHKHEVAGTIGADGSIIQSTYTPLVPLSVIKMEDVVDRLQEMKKNSQQWNAILRAREEREAEEKLQTGKNLENQVGKTPGSPRTPREIQEILHQIRIKKQELTKEEMSQEELIKSVIKSVVFDTTNKWNLSLEGNLKHDVIEKNTADVMTNSRESITPRSGAAAAAQKGWNAGRTSAQSQAAKGQAAASASTDTKPSKSVAINPNATVQKFDVTVVNATDLNPFGGSNLFGSTDPFASNTTIAPSNSLSQVTIIASSNNLSQATIAPQNNSVSNSNPFSALGRGESTVAENSNPFAPSSSIANPFTTSQPLASSAAASNPFATAGTGAAAEPNPFATSGQQQPTKSILSKGTTKEKTGGATSGSTAQQFVQAPFVAGEEKEPMDYNVHFGLKNANYNIRHFENNTEKMVQLANFANIEVLDYDFSPRRRFKIPNPTKSYVNRTNSMGWSALLLAAQCGHKNICELLLNNLADIDRASRTTMLTPLMLAASSGTVEIVELLLRKRADVWKTNVNKQNVIEIIKNKRMVREQELKFSKAAAAGALQAPILHDGKGRNVDIYGIGGSSRKDYQFKQVEDLLLRCVGGIIHT